MGPLSGMVTTANNNFFKFDIKENNLKPLKTT
jgi:hypothetical protein